MTGSRVISSDEYRLLVAERDHFKQEYYRLRGSLIDVRDTPEEALEIAQDALEEG